MFLVLKTQLTRLPPPPAPRTGASVVYADVRERGGGAKLETRGGPQKLQEVSFWSDVFGG